MAKKSKILNYKSKILKWVYPPSGWISNYKKTFVYGCANPKAKLFVNDKKIKIFSNGNFVKTIKLPKKKNVVRLVQILNDKRKIISRNVYVKSVGADQCVCPKIRQGKHMGLPLQNKNKIVIVIDPGHGGKEHGTHSPKGIPEKVFNLQIAKLLVGALHATPLQGKIYLTRTKDKFVSLKTRVNFAKKKKCNILISIHHNALPDNQDPLKHRGIGIYYTHDFVKPFAKSLLRSISKSSGLKKYGIFKRNFALTRPDFCHAVLIECGFLTHPVESEIVIQKKIQERIVKGIVEAIHKLLLRDNLTSCF